MSLLLLLTSTCALSPFYSIQLEVISAISQVWDFSSSPWYDMEFKENVVARTRYFALVIKLIHTHQFFSSRTKMLGRFLSRIDLLGLPIVFNFSKSKKVQSSFGGFWTLAFLAFVIWAIYNSGHELFAKKKPQVNQGVIYNPKIRPLELSSNTLPVAIAIEGDDYNIPVECKYSYILQLTPSSSDHSFSHWLAMEKCTKEHFAGFDGIIDDDTKDILDYYYCLPTISNYSSIYGFSLAAYCPLQSGLDSFINTTPTVELFYPKYGLTLQNYKNPIETYLFNYEIAIKNATTYSYWSLNHLNITTDRGWLTTSDTTAYYVSVTPQINPPVSFQGGVGVVFQFDIDKQELFYTRTYTKVQNVLAEVGGIAGSVLGVLLLFITPYTRIKLSETFVNEMFEIKLEKQQKATDEKQRRIKSKKSAKEMKNSEGVYKESFDGDETKRESLKVIELSKRVSKETANTSVLAKEKLRPTESAKAEKNESPYKSPLFCEDKKLLISVSANETICFQTSRAGESLVPQINNNTPPTSAKRSDSDVEEGPRSIHTVRPKELIDRFQTQKLFLSNHNEIIIPVDIKEERDGEIYKSLENLEADSSHPAAEVAVEDDNECRGEEQFRDEGDIQGQKDCDRDLDKAKLEDTKLSKGELFGIVQSVLPRKPKKLKRPKIIQISFLEYIKSFFYKSESTKEKLEILNKGLNILDSRLDIMSVLKKLREIDKVKGLIFDADQRFLFDKLPRPEINKKENNWFQEEYAPCYEIFKDSNELEELGIKAQIIDSKRRIQDKPKKSKIDKRILTLM